jgi:Methyltransferase domain
MSHLGLARRTILEMIPKNGIGAEVGVFKGDFSEELLQRTEPRRLHLIDPWVSVDDELHRSSHYSTTRRSQADMDQLHAGVTGRFSDQIITGRVVVHRARSAVALAALPDRSLDWIYIDGDHSYKTVISDLRLSFAKVKTGGFICGDDYQVDGWWTDGVIRAVHDFLYEAQSQVLIKLLVDAQFMLLVAD